MEMCKVPWKENLSAVTVFLAVALFFMVSCATNREIQNFHLNPADGDRAVFTHEGLTIALRYLEESDRTQYLRTCGRESLARGIRELSLSTFLIEVINNSDSEVIADPASIRLVTGTGQTLSPMNYAHLYLALPRGEGRQAVLQELQGVAFDRPVTVPQGGREDGLVFFQRPEKVSKEVAVVLGGLYIGGAQLKAILTFKAVPNEE